MTNIIQNLALCVPVVVSVWLAFRVANRLRPLPFKNALLVTTLLSLFGALAAVLVVFVAALTISSLPTASPATKEVATAVFQIYVSGYAAVSFLATIAGFFVGLLQLRKRE